MRFYASIPSPSISKMNGQDPSQRGGSYGSNRFDFGNIAGDPFALATISVSMVGLSHTLGLCVGWVVVMGD